MKPFASMNLPADMDVAAPDGSEIRLLPAIGRGSMVHCRVPPGAVTKAVRHRTVEELWYVLSGDGRLWRRQGERQEVARLTPGSAHTIPLGTVFQFRCDSDAPLQIVIVTMPPWPGASEAEPVADHWPPTLDKDRIADKD